MEKIKISNKTGARLKGIHRRKGTTVPYKRNHGITLIALVITIIILLILAGITINLTLGEHGIIKMAEKAGKNYVNSAEEEQKKLGGLWNEVDNIINGVQKFTANSNTKWKVLSANKETGEVVLISELPIQTDAGQEFYINGAIGYLYAEQELNEICKIYGYGKGTDTAKQFTCEIGDTVDGLQQITITGSGARSINENDINKITGYTKSTGQTRTINSYYPTLLQENGRSLTAKNQNRATTIYAYKGEDYLGTSNETYKILLGSSTNFNNYWIANRGVEINETGINGANFFTNRVYDGEVTEAINVAIWNGIFTDSSFSCGIRPIVYLKTNIETTGKSENGEWKLY